MNSQSNPSFSQYIQILKVLDKKEKKLFFSFLVLFLASSIFLTINTIIEKTEEIPVTGGRFIQGAIGSPRFINPIYADLSDADRDLSQLIFAGLLKYDNKGQLQPDLAKEYNISSDGRTFTVHLKDNLLWDDGEKITADDVIFTVETIQNLEYRSPLRAAWTGVESKKISDQIIEFSLRNTSAVFLENLTLKIIPKHIWQNIKPEQFTIDTHNLQPVGSGPYKANPLTDIKNSVIKSITLESNKNYFGNKPYIQEITFKFFSSEEELARAARRREIQGFSILNPQNFDIAKRQDFNSYVFSLPRYFAVFFNIENSQALKETKVRQALNYATDKQEIINLVFGDLEKQGKISNSPILPELYNIEEPKAPYAFNQETAKELLKETGFNIDESGKMVKQEKTDAISSFTQDLNLGSQGTQVRELQRCLLEQVPEAYATNITGSFDRATEAGVKAFQEKYFTEILEPWNFTEGTGQVSRTTRTKLNEVCDLSPYRIVPLKITLTTTDQPILMQVANILKEQWGKIGVELEISSFNGQSSERDNIIKNRNYEAILFGQALSSIPDPMPFWHSSQKKDPGLNLSSYENKEADQLMEIIRQSIDPEARAERLASFQNILIKDAPAVFLYTQDYVFITSKDIKGISEGTIIDPSKRFFDIENWYIKTKRVFK